MKLNEIKLIPKPQKLQDLAGLGIIRPYVGLKENYVYPPYFSDWQLNEMAYRVEWKEENHLLLGYFASPEFNYVIKIEPFEYMQYNCVNIAFEVFRKDGAEPTTELTTTSYPNSVFGTVLNASSEKITQFDVDAVVFIAVDNVEKRMAVYKRIAKKFSKNFGEVFEKIKLTNGEAIIIISNNIAPDDRKVVYDFVLNQSNSK